MDLFLIHFSVNLRCLVTVAGTKQFYLPLHKKHSYKVRKSVKVCKTRKGLSHYGSHFPWSLILFVHWTKKKIYIYIPQFLVFSLNRSEKCFSREECARPSKCIILWFKSHPLEGDINVLVCCHFSFLLLWTKLVRGLQNKRNNMTHNITF